ncbi:hypothetical protein M3Y97_00286400 [Aphelenchoides bicaudatus]|nr:hypothetical protein M3Y97_00286400 [Aphelenchoides bicaudatus]
MVYRKYREAKQWGKTYTRLFRTILRRKGHHRMPEFKVPEELQKMGVQIHDPNVPGFFDKPFERVEINHNMFRTPTDKDHPLYKAEKAYLFEGTRSFADGIDQACVLINALKARPFPDSVINSNKIEWPSNIEKLVSDSIMAGERYDPTLEVLPKRHDPILFWTIQRKFHGVPAVKKNNIILENLYRRVYLQALHNEHLQENRCDYASPLSVMLAANLFGEDLPFVIRHQPHLTIQSTTPVPRISSKAEVSATIDETPPDIYPILPTLDLKFTNIYNTEPIMPRSQIHSLHMNTLLFSKEQNQKYPFTTDELAANAIVFCFGAALAQAQRTAEKVDLTERPIVTKAVQLVDGHMDFVALQLNTLDLKKSDGVKNLVWVEKAQPLYRARSAYENLEQVEELDMDTFNKFASLLLY